MLCKNELRQAENGTTVFKIFYEEGYQYQLRCKKTFSYFFFSQIIPKMNYANIVKKILVALDLNSWKYWKLVTINRITGTIYIILY